MIVNVPENDPPDDGENLMMTLVDSPGERLKEPLPPTIENEVPFTLTLTVSGRVKLNEFVMTIDCSSDLPASVGPKLNADVLTAIWVKG